MLIIPPEELSPGALRGVLEEIVSRDGAEWTDVAEKVEQVQRHLRTGAAFLVYDEESRTCTIVSRDHLRRTGNLPDNQPT